MFDLHYQKNKGSGVIDVLVLSCIAHTQLLVFLGIKCRAYFTALGSSRKGTRARVSAASHRVAAGLPRLFWP